MIAVVWTTIALIAVISLFALYAFGFIIFALLFRHVTKEVKEFRGLFDSNPFGGRK